jgi:hypothetical protein
MRMISNVAGMIAFVAATVLIYSMAAIAQADISGFPVPEGDITKLLLDLATNYKALGLTGSLVIATLLTVQAIKAWVDDNWKYKRLLTLAVSIVYSVLAGMVIPGSNVATIVVSVFITSGGAVALYEALKGAGIIKKKPALA